MSKWQVVVVLTKTKEIIQSSFPSSLHQAEKIERGLSINLNHEQFHTELREVN